MGCCCSSNSATSEEGGSVQQSRRARENRRGRRGDTDDDSSVEGRRGAGGEFHPRHHHEGIVDGRSRGSQQQRQLARVQAEWIAAQQRELRRHARRRSSSDDEGDDDDDDRSGDEEGDDDDDSVTRGMTAQEREDHQLAQMLFQEELAYLHQQQQMRERNRPPRSPVVSGIRDLTGIGTILRFGDVNKASSAPKAAAPLPGDDDGAAADGVLAATEEPEECSLCMVELEEGCELRTLFCGHLFHRHCVDDWLRRKGTCPMCNQDATQPMQPVRSATPELPGGGRLRRAGQQPTEEGDAILLSGAQPPTASVTDVNLVMASNASAITASAAITPEFAHVVGEGVAGGESPGLAVAAWGELSHSDDDGEPFDHADADENHVDEVLVAETSASPSSLRPNEGLAMPMVSGEAGVAVAQPSNAGVSPTEAAALPVAPLDNSSSTASTNPLHDAPLSPLKEGGTST